MSIRPGFANTDTIVRDGATTEVPLARGPLGEPDDLQSMISLLRRMTKALEKLHSLIEPISVAGTHARDIAATLELTTRMRDRLEQIMVGIHGSRGSENDAKKTATATPARLPLS